MMDLCDENWRTSSYSGGGNACVEVGYGGTAPTIRDTKDRLGGRITTTPHQWAAFLSGLKAGRYDG